MISIKEREGKLLNFFTPLMVVIVGSILLSFFGNLISLIIYLIDPLFQWDYTIVNLLILIISQILGILIVYFLIIPLYKAKNVEYQPPNLRNLIRTIYLICGTFSAVFVSNYVLLYFCRVFNIIPQGGYNELLLRLEHLANPLNILIYYLPFAIGAPIYEELVYRRLLIPLLEKRGMSPLIAVTSSSLIFAIAHLPSDLIYGNLSGGIIHIWGIFIIGMSLGVIYVLSRNILYPIIIHGVLNFISFSSPLIIILGNELMILSYNIIIWIIIIIGAGVLFIVVWQLLRKKKVEWVIILKEKAQYNIKKGILGLLILGIISVFLPIVLQLAFINVALNNVLLYFVALICSNALVIILFLWLGTKANYESNNTKNLLKNNKKNKNLEV
ncbi:MAG: lysostaphin resistance A-like protein [Promethearchaeota archaeon]